MPTPQADNPERNALYAREIENFFRTRLVDNYDELSAKLWNRDYSDEDAYAASVADRREAWRKVLNPPTLERQGDVKILDNAVADAQWLKLPLEDGLNSQGLLMAPERPSKLVVFQHGLGSTPEKVFGVGDVNGIYDNIGHRLVEAGYAVLAPMNLIPKETRNRVQSLARLAGTTMEGIELTRFQHLLDAVDEVAPQVDTSNFAFAGMSWGGLAAQFWPPLEPRVAASATLGFFNNRQNKMLVQDMRYRTFHDAGEHHAYLHGHLLGFSDADLASLICPRPFMVQYGKADPIGWWPQIVDEFERTRYHWDQLGLGDRVHLDMPEHGHAVDAEPVVRWIERWFPA